MAELYGTVRNGTCKTGMEIYKTFTSSQNYTIPQGFKTCTAFLVGGGGGGCRGDNNRLEYGGAGAGSGRTGTFNLTGVVSGQVLNIVVGSGGVAGNVGNTGGDSLIKHSNQILANVKGGSGENYTGGSGGSGGGQGGFNDSGNGRAGGYGGSNGGDGQYKSWRPVGTGQGTTTRAWGSSNGTLYAGGGGGGGAYKREGGSGGSGGGGNGGAYETAGTNGAANTGGGGGGDGCGYDWPGNGGNGSSGIVLLKLC